MRKRLALFIIGFVLAIGAFLLYQGLTGAIFLGTRTPPTVVATTQVDNRPLSIEERRPTGELEYLMNATKAVSLKDDKGQNIPGQFLLTAPSAMYYSTDGQILFIRADTGTLAIASAKSGKPTPLGGRLSGNVKLLLSPRNLPVDPSGNPQPGQTQVTLDKDVDISVTDSLLTSMGGVHVRSEVITFDGENLTIAFNRSQKRIEFLRIEPTSGKDNKIRIKFPERGPGQGSSLFDRDLTDNLGGRKPSAVAPAPARIASASSTTYRLSFGQNVSASLGTSYLTSDRLYVLFMTGGETPAAATRSTLLSPPETPENPAPESQPATTATTTSSAANELTVTWTGPMEMRPTGADDLQLVDTKDRAFQALGTAERPVFVRDGNRNILAGSLWYHQAEQRVEIEPGILPRVQLNDPAVGVLICQRVSLFQGNNTLKLLGPGAIEVPPSALHREGQNPSAKPLLIAWNKTVDVQLASTPDANNPGKTRQTLRHALLTGDVVIRDIGFDLASDALDLLVATPTETRGSQALEHLLATGNVHLKAARSGAALDDKPDGLNADRFELFTSPLLATNIPSPSRALATGHVSAWTYSSQIESTADANPKPAADKRLGRQTIYTPTLDVALEPKDRSSTTAPDTGTALGSGTTIKNLSATDGVKVELEGFDGAANDPVIATAHALTADPKSGKVVLQGDLGLLQPNGIAKQVSITRGDNLITGQRVLLDQKAHSIEIPGPGTFVFVDPAKKPGADSSPVHISWTKNMSYDAKAMLALFAGEIVVQRNGADETSKLTCHDLLQVDLAQGAPSDKPGAPASHATHLAHLLARGDVEAEGSQLDAAKKPVTRMYLRTAELRYNDETKTLDIPGPGAMLVEDFRVDKPALGANPLDAANARGTTAFKWAEKLAYNGSTGVVTMTRDVVMKHLPTKPLRLAAAGTDVKTQPVQEIVLTAPVLSARMLQSRETGGGQTVASPVALGSGGNMKLAGAKADGGAHLQVGTDEISGYTLDFDALKNIATAIGKGSEPAFVVRPGQDLLAADQIIWNLTKDHNAFELIHPRGNIQAN